MLVGRTGDVNSVKVKTRKGKILPPVSLALIEEIKMATNRSKLTIDIYDLTENRAVISLAPYRPRSQVSWGHFALLSMIKLAYRTSCIAALFF